MTPLLDQPVTYEAANKWLAARVSVPTVMNSEQLALSRSFANSLKASSFFSAQVADARVLARLREVSDSYSAGKTTLAEARNGLQTFLRGEGYKPEDMSDENAGKNTLDNLASSARLDLILEQNASMARAIGDREVSYDPDVMERFPCFEYVHSISNSPRPEHAKYAGLVLEKTDPFWDTHTPPWDYGCQCSLRDVERPEDQDKVATSEAPEKPGDPWLLRRGDETIEAPAPESGFVFDVKSAFGTLDMARVEDVPTRRAVMEQIKDFASNNEQIDFKCIPADLPLSAAPVEPESSLEQIDSFIQRSLAKPDAAESMRIGSLSQEVADSLGIESANLEFTTWNVSHIKKDHLDDLQGEKKKFLTALRETFFLAGTLTSMEFKKGTVYLAFWNEKTHAFGAAIKAGEGWENWRLIQAFIPSDDYDLKHRRMS